MSEIIKTLRDSADPLENDLARALEHWQETKRSQGQKASLGYEPRDINSLGAVSVISSRVLSAATGFEDVDQNQSYEALVLKHPERFPDDVIDAAQERLKLGSSKLDLFRRQHIQFFVKSSAIELFGESGVQPTVADWVGRRVHLPELHKDNSYVDDILKGGFRGLVWLHEHPINGERGRGLTALVEFGPLDPERNAECLAANFFEHPVGKDLLEAHRGDGSFIAKINMSPHSRIWRIDDDDVLALLSAVRQKAQKIAEFENKVPDVQDALNLEKIEDTTALRQVVLRYYQDAFRRELLAQRRNCCAITGTNEISVLEAAHIIPYAHKFADRDKLENGLLLRSDIHKLFDAHLISINPKTMKIEISERIKSPEYLMLHGKTIEDKVSSKCLDFHFENFQKMR